MKVNAKLYDGVSSKEHNVTIEFTPNNHIVVEDFNIDLPLSSVKIATRLGNTPRLIEFPNGIRCKCQDNDKIDEILKELNYEQPIIHKLERSWRLAIGAFVAMFIAIAFMLTIGSEYTASALAKIVPQGSLDYPSHQALKQLDKSYLNKSNLTKAKKEKIQKIFAKVTGGNKRYKLHFRSSPLMGPNAFALPSGDIVLIDELVFLDKDKELRGIEGVLAHEMGHVVYRHSLKGAIKGTIASAVIGYVAGDLSFLATSVPTLLVTTGYSRKFEAQADDFAIKRMKELGVDTKPMAKLFENLEKHFDKKYGKDKTNMPSWISTHPATKDRIKKLLKASNSINSK